jgi:chromosome segregation ATPase
MIEPIMYFGIGFLIAALIGLVVIPLVHGRAVRLTMRRLEAATPLSMAEIQADKDQLRAEFAMSTRRLEMSVEQLKGRTTSQLSELSKKTDAINRLKVELGEKTATIYALEARDKALRDQLRASEEEFVVRSTAVQDAERALNDKQSELAKMMSELDDRSVLADSQKVEIIALKTQIEALKERLSDAEKAVRDTEDRVAHERVELKEATGQLSSERGKVENLGRRVSELEQQLIAQSTEAEMLGRRAHDLETRLTEQSKALSESDFERTQLREQMNGARKTEADLRAAISEINGKTGSATETLRAEKAQLQAELQRANEERARLAAEIGDMKRDTEQAWSSERVENSLLRERINDVAAEVARLASALEGPNSPIDAILAAETARDKGALPPVSLDTEPAAAGGGNLADRIRALQSHASRIQQSDDPTSRN